VKPALLLVPLIACAEAQSIAPPAARIVDAETLDVGFEPSDAGFVDAAASSEDAETFADAVILDAIVVDASPIDAGPSSGRFTMLSYNVAGLPDVISGSNPRVNTPLISPLLDAFDLVLVQEDFAYHEALISQVTHPFQSTPLDPAGVNMGDGLNRLSRSAFVDHQRITWEECNGFFDQGSDCLTDKGFDVARHQLAPGVSLEIYDVHLDAGRGQADADARIAQIAQLVAHVQARVGAGPVIIAGDTNLKEDDEAALLDLLAALSLEDSCRNLGCDDPGLHDRIMYRSSPGLVLTATTWRLDPRFVDGMGEPLSDHDALGVDFEWSSP
jgi:hypothetical protein